MANDHIVLRGFCTCTPYGGSSYMRKDCFAYQNMSIISRDLEKGTYLAAPDEVTYRDSRSAARERIRERKRRKRQYSKFSKDSRPSATPLPPSRTPGSPKLSSKRTGSRRNRGRETSNSHAIPDVKDPSDLDDYLPLEESCYWYDFLYDAYEGITIDPTSPNHDTDTADEECFINWCHRRINEMRAVKEARLYSARVRRPASPPTRTPPSPSTATAMRTDDDDDEGYHSSASSTSYLPTTHLTTTQPTNLYDVEGHALLDAFLAIPADARCSHSWSTPCVWPDDLSSLRKFPHNSPRCWSWMVYDLVRICGWHCCCHAVEEEVGLTWGLEHTKAMWLAECIKGAGWEGLWDVHVDISMDWRVEEQDEEVADDGWDVVSVLSTTESWDGIDEPFGSEILC